MIFDNPGLVDLSPELDIFLWKIARRALPKNFALSTDGNDLKLSLCHKDFLLY